MRAFTAIVLTLSTFTFSLAQDTPLGLSASEKLSFLQGEWTYTSAIPTGKVPDQNWRPGGYNMPAPESFPRGTFGANPFKGKLDAIRVGNAFRLDSHGEEGSFFAESVSFIRYDKRQEKYKLVIVNETYGRIDVFLGVVRRHKESGNPVEFVFDNTHERLTSIDTYQGSIKTYFQVVFTVHAPPLRPGEEAIPMDQVLKKKHASFSITISLSEGVNSQWKVYEVFGLERTK